MEDLIIRRNSAVLNESFKGHSKLLVVSDDGSQLGTLSPKEALAIADEKGLDLVMVAPNATPPVCKIMDYGRHKYEKEKKQKEAKKKQQIVNLKELTVSYKIGEHDFQVRLNQIKKFIGNGDKVKMNVKLRGRERQHSELAIELLKKFYEEVKEIADFEKKPGFEGRQVLMILVPKSK